MPFPAILSEEGMPSRTGGPLHPPRGFSLVEVLLAIGIVSFAVLALVALLPIGLQVVKNSGERTQAIDLISALSSDFKNSPVTNSASAIFGLTPLPWGRDGQGRTVATAAVGVAHRYWATDGLTILSAPSESPPGNAAYRITLRYTRAPGASLFPSAVPALSSPAPVEALIVVSWPPALDPFAPGNAPRLQGRVESYLTFPQP